MLYDTKWDKPQVDVMSTTSLIAWLERRDATETYCYYHTGECLLAQYFQENYPGAMRVSTRYLYPINRPLPDGWNAVAGLAPHTFGAALTRARALLAEAAS